MRYSKTILKSILLSATIFWIVIFSENFEANMLFWAFISIIPITICCLLTILFTIAPWFNLNSKQKPQKIYENYFPFYAILSFTISVYIIYNNSFGIYAISFCSSASLTSLQTWNWLISDNQSTNLIER